MAKNKVEETEVVEKVEAKKETEYSKVQLVSSKKYSANKDLLQVLLQDNKNYTIKEVDNKIKEFKGRKV